MTELREFRLRFGDGEQVFSLPEACVLGELRPNAPESGAAAVLAEEAELRRALAEPIGAPRLRDVARAGARVVIVTSDITRPLPSYKVLPPVLEELYAAGIPESDITIVFGLGSHRPHTQAEREKLLGAEICRSGIRILDSDPADCVRLGVCHNGTPVDIFRPVAEADLRVCLGNIEYHYFAGYSGGCKALMPGVSSREAIRANHANMIQKGAFAGNLTGNPVRDDIEQIQDFLRVDYIINVVLDENKHILKAVAGDAVAAHRAGCDFLDAIYKVPIGARAEVVVFSPGGYPKDINLYQAQKGLDNAKHAVLGGGVLVWCASCREGLGEATFERWMTTMTPDEMVAEIRENFVLGGHKAAAIAMVLQQSRIFFVSDMDADLVRRMGFEPFATLQAAVDAALAAVDTGAEAGARGGAAPGVYVMPFAGSTLPVVRV